MANLDEEKETRNTKDKEIRPGTGLDPGLITMFLKMTPEERVQSNDNAVNTIMELRNAFTKK